MKIGFIGLGAMGRGMAANLQRTGVDLVVHDVKKDAAAEFLENGATWAATPSEMAAQVGLVFTSLPTPQDVEAVALGRDGLGAGFADTNGGQAWFDLSTNSVEVVRRLHTAFAGQGVALLDAPVSGGPTGAANGRLAIWIGGDRAAYDRHLDVLNMMSDDPRYIGPIGAGTIAKLTHNMASITLNAVIAEVLTMGVKAGVEPAALWAAIRNGAAGRARTFDSPGRRFLQGNLDPPSFALRLAFKDAQLAIELAKDSGVPMRLCSLATLELSEAVNRGWGDRDVQSFMLLQQERANVPPFALTAEEVANILAQRAESAFNAK